MPQTSLEKFEKALRSLERGYIDKPSELERDGLIQRFEYTLEVAWKTSKKVLLSSGVETDSPKNVIRELGNLNWISNPADWLIYLERRNETSHMYNEEVAVRIFLVLKSFIADANVLLSVLSDKNR
jgi:nucleotidyltransferase substrate binding protein (TIGR01987 family)